MSTLSSRGFVVGVLGSLFLAGAIAACSIVTGSTDGYTSAQDASTPEVDSSCSFVLDGGVCVVNACTTSADCPTTDAGAPICCEGFLGLSTIGTACSVGTCAFGSFQACTSSSECGGEACVEQQCSLPPDALNVKACGLIPGCSVVGGGTADSGPSTGVDAGGDAGGIVQGADAGQDAGTVNATDAGDGGDAG